MTFDWSIKFGDIALVFATLFAPFAAIQAQKYLERWHDKERQRSWVFRTLMSTRLQALSEAHINALNAVPIDFNKNAKVLEAWRQYFIHLGKPADTTPAWAQKRAELLIELLHTIATALNYSFEKSQIETEIYSPNAQVQQDIDQQTIRRGLVALVKGEWALPMNVTGFPADGTALKEQEALRQLLSEWLSGKRSVPMEIRTPSGDGDRNEN